MNVMTYQAEESKPQLTTNPSIFAAIVAAQKAAQAVHKASKNSHQGYKYASSEDVIAEARACLNGAGLALFTTGFRIVTVEADKRLQVEYMLVHESGSTLLLQSETTIHVAGAKDKAEAAAKTYDLAYFLRNLLLLPRVEEEQVDQRNDSVRSAPAQAPAQVAAVVAPSGKDFVYLANGAKTLDDVKAVLIEAMQEKSPQVLAVQKIYSARAKA